MSTGDEDYILSQLEKGCTAATWAAMTLGIVTMTNRLRNIKLLIANRRQLRTESEACVQELDLAINQGFVPDVSTKQDARAVAQTPWFRGHTEGQFTDEPDLESVKEAIETVAARTSDAWFTGPPPSHESLEGAAAEDAGAPPDGNWFLGTVEKKAAEKKSAEEEARRAKELQGAQIKARRLAARKLLAERLAFMNLTTVVMKGDGNCQFRALSHQMYGTQDYHLDLRREACDQILSQRELYEHFIEGRLESYVRRMKTARTWGDQISLQAAVDALGLEVHVVNTYEECWHVKHVPNEAAIPKSDRGCHKKRLFLSYLVPEHYDSVVTLEFTKRVAELDVTTPTGVKAAEVAPGSKGLVVEPRQRMTV